MKSATHGFRIGRAFGLERLQPLSFYSSRGHPLTVAEIILSEANGGCGYSRFSDDAYFVLTNLGAACDVGVARRGRASTSHHVPPRGILAIDLNHGFDLEWTGALHMMVAYLPRRAIFEGDDQVGLEPAIDTTRCFDDELLTAIMACLRHSPIAIASVSYVAFARQMLATACACLARKHAAPVRSDRRRDYTLSDEQQQRALDYMLLMIESRISIPEVAKACGLSYDTFIRAFKRSLGATPHDWIMVRRLERSKELMRDRSLRLSDVAQMAGFCDQSHFNRVFTRFTACTPGAWRRNPMAA